MFRETDNYIKLGTAVAHALPRKTSPSPQPQRSHYKTRLDHVVVDQRTSLNDLQAAWDQKSIANKKDNHAEIMDLIDDLPLREHC